jgi:hypothetical protein
MVLMIDPINFIRAIRLIRGSLGKIAEGDRKTIRGIREIRGFLPELPIDLEFKRKCLTQPEGICITELIQVMS